jgi:hypothetical protein
VSVNVRRALAVGINADIMLTFAVSIYACRKQTLAVGQNAGSTLSTDCLLVTGGSRLSGNWRRSKRWVGNSLRLTRSAAVTERKGCGALHRPLLPLVPADQQLG